MNMNINTLEKTLISVGQCWLADGIFGLEVKRRAYFGIDELEELRSVYSTLTKGKPVKRLIILKDKFYIGKDAGERLLLNEVYCTCEAIASSSFKYRGLLTMYTLRRSSKYPIKVFSTVSKATRWLLAYS